MRLTTKKLIGQEETKETIFEDPEKEVKLW